MKKPFSAWTEGARFYIPPIILALALLIGFYPGPLAYALGLPVLLLGLFTLYFFRDPTRAIPPDDASIVSPADGVVVAIEELEDTPHYNGPCKRVSIFLSVFNVHVNRAPVTAVVTDIAYQPGAFKNAMRADTTDLNEANAIRMDAPFGPLTVRQISGLIARRIVCKCEVGETLQKGERFGMIRFGSRTELYLPVNTEICVKLKDKVRAGATVIARTS